MANPRNRRPPVGGTNLRQHHRAAPLSSRPPECGIFFLAGARYTPRVSETLVINEVYLSLQGESTFAGLPCVFIRLTACDLRCSYCDTAYAFTEGRKQSLSAILARVDELAAPYRSPEAGARVRDPQHPVWPEPPGIRPPSLPGLEILPLVELTGGEPLLQKNSLPLMRHLCDAGYTVLLETSGAHDISLVDPRVRRIMDLKCPGSGEAGRNLPANLARLRPADEIKFVVGTREDYDWMKEQIHIHHLAAVCPLLCSWVHPLTPDQQHPALKPVPAGHTPVSRRELAELIIADALPVRFQAQLHKLIWPPEQRGV
jgi:7-carboxy-7-deazaguanine synthase